jgi:anti-sigma-K factor RskA
MADQMPHHDLAGYVLGTLTLAETRAFEAHLPGCPDCAAEVAELESLPSLLASAAPSPPATLRDRTLAAIAAEASALGPVTGQWGPTGPPSPPAATPPAARPATPPPATPTPLPFPPPVATPPPATPSPATPPAAGSPAPSVVTPMRPRRSRAVRWVTAVAAMLLVAAVAGAGAAVLLGREPSGTPAATIALAATEGRSGQGEAVVRQVAGGHEIRLEVSGMPANPDQTFYECWLVGPTDTAQAPSRVAVGTFSVGADGKATVTWATAADLERFPKLGVTLEPENGDPGTNGPKVLAG